MERQRFEGVIRNVNKRRTEVVTAINTLLDERRMGEFEARSGENATAPLQPAKDELDEA